MVGAFWIGSGKGWGWGRWWVMVGRRDGGLDRIRWEFLLNFKSCFSLSNLYLLLTPKNINRQSPLPSMLSALPAGLGLSRKPPSTFIRPTGILCLRITGEENRLKKKIRKFLARSKGAMLLFFMHFRFSRRERERRKVRRKILGRTGDQGGKEWWIYAF